MLKNSLNPINLTVFSLPERNKTQNATQLGGLTNIH